ncbi:MAG: pilus assembly protein PilM [Candidatus Omnitrophica bacterium]|nr:pilus assembly protein PilM [Candidatus Omnitrophota bacterium]
MITLPNSKISTKKSFVAINLGNNSVKGVVVSANKIVDYFIEKKDDLPVLLKDIWSKKRNLPEKVKISLKDPATLIRYFNFPKLDKKKMRAALFFELNKHIPFLPQEVYFDYAILEEASPREVFLLLAVAKKQFIDAIVSAFQNQGLKIIDINLDSVCLANLFLKVYKEEKNKNSAILDIGHSCSSLSILKDGLPFVTRDLEFNGSDAFSTLSHMKALPLKEIEAWVESPENSGEFLSLIQYSISNLAKEIKNSFDYFELNKGERVQTLYLTGGLANLAELNEVFSESLGLEVKTLGDFSKLNLSLPDAEFDKVKNGLAVSLGLSL